MRHLLVILTSLFIVHANAKVAPLVKKYGVGGLAEDKVEQVLKESIIELIQNNKSLKDHYNKEMTNIFDFLDPERIPTAADLYPGAISVWRVHMGFRYGQGDYQFCDINTEDASYVNSVYMIGFETSYKREVYYGLQATVSLNSDWCSGGENFEDVTKERLIISFNKWIPSADTYNLLFTH